MKRKEGRILDRARSEGLSECKGFIVVLAKKKRTLLLLLLLLCVYLSLSLIFSFAINFLEMGFVNFS